jgi:hypothetical protein
MQLVNADTYPFPPHIVDEETEYMWAKNSARFAEHLLEVSEDPTIDLTREDRATIRDRARTWAAVSMAYSMLK